MRYAAACLLFLTMIAFTALGCGVSSAPEAPPGDGPPLQMKPFNSSQQAPPPVDIKPLPSQQGQFAIGSSSLPS
jgi:hypothetical protein